MFNQFIVIWLMAFSLLLNGHTKASEKLELLVGPNISMIDMNLDISVTGSRPDKLITLKASSIHPVSKIKFTSSATFQTDKAGKIDLAKDQPKSGSYSSIDSMGLIWSMEPEDGSLSSLTAGNIRSIEVSFELFEDQIMRDTKLVTLNFCSPELHVEPVNSDGLKGVMYAPSGLDKYPGVLIIHGSGGIVPETMAMYLASHGYSALALGYFGEETLPAELVEINLEYFLTAIQHLKSHKLVDYRKIGLIGVSRGGECSLILTSLFPQHIQALVCFVPSHLVNGGSTKPNKPAWLFQGVPAYDFIPALNNSSESLSFIEDTQQAMENGILPIHKGNREDPHQPLFWASARTEKYRYLADKAAIPVEKIQCPLLILSGKDDCLWASSTYGDQIIARLEKSSSSVERKHIAYEGAGHVFFMLPNQPVLGSILGYHGRHGAWITFGGTAEGNAKAARKAWSSILEFLQKKLG